VTARPSLYLDLVGLPFLKGSDDPALGGIDCWGVTRIVLRRLGLADPGGLVDPWEARTRVGASLVAAKPDARSMQLGDVLAFGGTPPTHVAPVVALDPPLVLHARRGGSLCVLEATRLVGVVGVYRFPPA